MPNRSSLTSDAYQESHLAAVFSAWSRKMYLFLGLFTGAMAVIVFVQRAEIIPQPLMGWAGYYFAQVLTGGMCLMSLYGVITMKQKGQIDQGRSRFSWWGFWLRDFYMAAVFAPFALLVGRALFAGAGEGAFIDLGGWDSLSDPATPWGQRILLGLMGLLILAFLLVMALIPLWLLWRSCGNLWIQLTKGTATAQFDAKQYAPGDSVSIAISNSRASNPATARRVFMNLIQRPADVHAPASKKGFMRQYLHSEYQDTTVENLANGLSFVLPDSIPEGIVTSAHLGPDHIRYWEILVEVPQEKYWSRFLFLVE